MSYNNDAFDDRGESGYEPVVPKNDPPVPIRMAADPQPKVCNFTIADCGKAFSAGKRPIIILSVLLAIVFLLAVVSITLGNQEMRRLREQVEKFQSMQNTVETEVGQPTSNSGTNDKANASFQLLAENIRKELLTEFVKLNSSLHLIAGNTEQSLLSEFASLNDTVKQINSRATNNQNQLNSVQRKVNTIDGSLDQVRTKANDTVHSLHRLNSSLYSIAADTKQELLSDVGVLNATMQQIKSQSANNLNQLNSVRSSVNTLSGSFNQVRTTVNQHTANITALGTRIGDQDFDYTYNSYKRSYIRLVKLSKSWDYAQIHCGAAGEYLLTFSSTSEARWFRDLKAGKSDWGYNTWIGLRGYGICYRWYGYSISDLSSSSWDSYWDSDDPDYTSPSYCGYSSTNGLWWDTNCYKKYYFFCEKL